jgi:diphthamide synthase (EF-2-diphthine--ammonia ligase)
MQLGTAFTRELHDQALQCGWDGFGENGEFHTLAQVWETDSVVALG